MGPVGEGSGVGYCIPAEDGIFAYGTGSRVLPAYGGWYGLGSAELGVCSMYDLGLSAEGVARWRRDILGDGIEDSRSPGGVEGRVYDC